MARGLSRFWLWTAPLSVGIAAAILFGTGLVLALRGAAGRPLGAPPPVRARGRGCRPEGRRLPHPRRRRLAGQRHGRRDRKGLRGQRARGLPQEGARRDHEPRRQRDGVPRGPGARRERERPRARGRRVPHPRLGRRQRPLPQHHPRRRADRRGRGRDGVAHELRAEPARHPRDAARGQPDGAHLRPRPLRSLRRRPGAGTHRRLGDPPVEHADRRDRPRISRT